MLKACLLCQKVLGRVALTAAVLSACAWFYMIVFDEGPLFQLGNQKCIDLSRDEVVWGELRGWRVTHPSGVNTLEFSIVPLRTVPTWSIVLGLSVAASGLLLLTPWNSEPSQQGSEC